MKKQKNGMKFYWFAFLIFIAVPNISHSQDADYQQTLEKARLGDARAQFNLGLAYDRGEGVAENAEKAVYWYRRAAEQGYANAQSNLGVYVNAGKGVTQDYKEAVRWFRKAAEQENAHAQFALGALYYAEERALLKMMRKQFIGPEKQQTKGMRMLNII